MEEYIHIFAQGKNKNHTVNVRSEQIIPPGIYDIGSLPKFVINFDYIIIHNKSNNLFQHNTTT